MISFIQPIKLLQTALLVVAQTLLCLSLTWANLGNLAAVAPLHGIRDWIAQAPTETLDIDRAAKKADEASEDIYKGLDTTKRVIGKTDKRNQIIEQAREQASENWKSLAEKAKAAETTDTDLTSTEKRVLQQVQN